MIFIRRRKFWKSAVKRLKKYSQDLNQNYRFKSKERWLEIVDELKKLATEIHKNYVLSDKKLFSFGINKKAKLWEKSGKLIDEAKKKYEEYLKHNTAEITKDEKEPKTHTKSEI